MASVPVVYLRRRRRAERIPTPPPFPEPFFAPSEHIPQLIHSLALPANFAISTPSTRSLLKHALYAFAIDPDSPHRALFFPDFDKGKGRDQPIDDTWTLAKAQGDVGGEYSESRRGKVCGHVFRAGESVYRCRDCSLDNTCVLCSKCFHGSSHTKHDVTMSVHAGLGAGCCDCGDVEAFKEGSVMDCKYHSLQHGRTSDMEDDSAPTTSEADVAALKRTIEQLLRVLLDWVISVLEASPDEVFVPTSVEAISATKPPTYRAFGSNPIDEITTDDDMPPDGGATSIPPSYLSSVSRAAEPSSSSAGEETSVPAGPWSVVLWNDEKHSFSQVIDQVSRATGVSHREAADVAQRVDTHGRDVVYISSDPSQLLLVSRLIAEIDLAVNVRSSLEVFFEQVAGELVVFFKDLCAAKVGGQGGVLSEVLAQVLVERTGGPDSKSRFQRLVDVDSRLWKEARKGLAEVYVILLGVSQTIKMEISLHFAQIYPRVAESYLLYDREPEHSIINFGVQVFTVPSVSVYLVKEHNFLTNIISILFSFFTEQIDATNRRRLILPPLSTVRRVDPESGPFRQKRYFQVFSDLNHLLSSTPVRQLICENTELIEPVISFLDLFTSMNPNKRAVSTHVEYESDAWVAAFNVTIQLGKICRSFGEAYRLATPLQLYNALTQILQKLPGPRPTFHAVNFGGSLHQLIDFKVESQPVSFHHPVAWLFSEMVKNIDALDSAALMAGVGIPSASHIIVGRQSPLPFLAAMDHPLRVIVLVAQIRASLWVRNGFGIRAQQLHYKEYSLRENTYDQDLYFLQMALVVLDPSLILIAMLDRFQVQDWLGGYEDHPTYDPGQAFAMVEEMLYVLILLLSDPTFVAGLDNEQCLRREVIHHLCLAPLPYSDLVRRVSEKFADDPALERVLASVANFKAPVGTSDQGTYSLKKECFSEVNPYFSRYSRNQREEADKIVREKLKKASGSTGEPVIVPTKLNIQRGPFITLSQTFNSEVLAQIIFFAMQHGRARGPTLFSEVLVDEAIHLTMLALVEQPDFFAAFASERMLSPIEDEHTLVHLLAKIETDERMKGVRHKARWCLDRLTEIVGPSVTALRKIEDPKSPATSALEAKRLAAKARQAAIMQQFSQAQQSFLASSENVDDEDEDDEAMEGDEGTTKKRVSMGSCIVCQDELTAQAPFGSLAFVQTSNIIRVTPEGHNFDFLEEVLATPSSLDRDASAIRPLGIAAKKVPVSPDDESGDGVSRGFPQANQSGLHASACGHMMHLACFETYYRSIEQRHMTQLTRCHPENTERSEFVCPLCKSLGNVLLPAGVGDFTKSLSSIDQRDVDTWATVVLDPVANASEKGIPASEVGEFYARAQQMRGRNPLVDQVNNHELAAWDLSNNFFKTSLREQLSGDNLMISRLLGVGFALLQEVGEQKAYLPTDLIAYTLSCIEVASRGSGEFASSTTEPTTRLVQGLLQILHDLVIVQAGSTPEKAVEVASSLVPFHLGGLFVSTEGQAANPWSVHPLATVIEAAAIMPQSFHQVTAFAFYTELVQLFPQVIALFKNSDGPLTSFVPATNDEPDDALEDYAALAKIRHFFLSPLATGFSAPGAELTLGKYLYAYALPFLRRAAIIQRALFGPPPGDEEDIYTSSEMSRLLDTLRIPALDSTLDRQQEPNGNAMLRAHIEFLIVSMPGWTDALSDAPKVDPSCNMPSELGPVLLSYAHSLEHPAIYELVGLPLQLDTLAAESLRRVCDRCKQVPAEPAMCLLCGQIVCNQSFCCMDGEEEAQHGECNMHMWTCGGSVGIFFLIKKNAVLYLYTDKGTFATPPYLDSHGEVDPGGRRGRSQFPQFLHQGRFDEIRKNWLQHGIATFVARKLEALTDNGGWTTM
ncbi:hypothetical protein T439DRAFT_316609 [Meredithblackwellia eburnea MCA 4105]